MGSDVDYRDRVLLVTGEVPAANQWCPSLTWHFSSIDFRKDLKEVGTGFSLQMAHLNLHVLTTVECLISHYHQWMFGHSQMVDLENDSADPEEDVCICLSDSLSADFSDYIWRCTHLFDVQTSEHRSLTL